MKRCLMKNPSIKRWERRKVQDHKGETSLEAMIIENCYSSTRYLYLILQNPQKKKRKNCKKAIETIKDIFRSQRKQNQLQEFCSHTVVCGEEAPQPGSSIHRKRSIPPEKKKTTLYEDRKEERKKNEKKNGESDPKKKGKKEAQEMRSEHWSR
jgi:hypothetical protein